VRVLLFGATGMVGQGVLRECLLDADVTEVVAVGRSGTGQTNVKLRDVIVPDLFNLAPLPGFDACFFTIGQTSAGMSEEDYTRLTFDLTMAVAKAVINPKMTFVFVSGAGTGGKAMWARVKGRAENALMQMPFKAAYMFRPGFIQPMHGIKSRTRSYRVFYMIFGWLMPILRRLFPAYVTSTEQIGRAMLAVAKQGYPKKILETGDINKV
jgi:uncharacterized protein YbjT (DUF2867 family)